MAAKQIDIKKLWELNVFRFIGSDVLCTVLEIAEDTHYCFITYTPNNQKGFFTKVLRNTETFLVELIY